MKIIKHGDPSKYNPTVLFVCSNCGCKFMATRSEYTEKIVLGVKIRHCDCPDCGEEADRKKYTLEEVHKINKSGESDETVLAMLNCDGILNY